MHVYFLQLFLDEIDNITLIRSIEQVKIYGSVSVYQILSTGPFIYEPNIYTRL